MNSLGDNFIHQQINLIKYQVIEIYWSNVYIINV